MKTIATTVLLVCAFLGAGCSDSDETSKTSGPNPTLTPLPDYTMEEIAVMKDASPSHQSQAGVEDLPALTAATAAPIRTIVGKQIETTPTPTP